MRRDQVKLGKRSGALEVIGKRNKHREVPLNATARKALEEYLAALPSDSVSLFPSGKTKAALSERALGYIVKKYAQRAKLVDVSPHDLRHRFGYRMAESVPLHGANASKPENGTLSSQNGEAAWKSVRST